MDFPADGEALFGNRAVEAAAGRDARFEECRRFGAAACDLQPNLSLYSRWKHGAISIPPHRQQK